MKNTPALTPSPRAVRAKGLQFLFARQGGERSESNHGMAGKPIIP